MTIAAVDPWCAYEGSGNRGPFSFQDGSVSIPFAAKAHVTVQRVSSAGVATTLTEGVHYTWSTFVQDATTRLYTGAVTIDAGEDVLAEDEKIVIFRDRALDQTYDQAYNSRFDTAALNRQMDRIFAQVQEVQRDANRAIKLPKWEQGPSDLSDAERRASKWVGFDSSGALSLGVPSEAATYVDWGEFTSTASQSTFTIYNNQIVDEALITIDIGGAMQGPGDYTATLSGANTLVTFTTPLSAGQSVLWRVNGKMATTDASIPSVILPVVQAATLEAARVALGVRSEFRIETYRASGATDSQALAAAITAASAAGGGFVVCLGATYEFSAEQVLPSFVYIVGVPGVTTWKRKSGYTGRFLYTTDYDSLASTSSEQGPEYFGLLGIRIHGDYTNIASGSLASAGRCLSIFGRAYLLRDVEVWYCPQEGIVSEWGDGAGYEDNNEVDYDLRMECVWDNVRIQYCRKGPIFNGPHDAFLSVVHGGLNWHNNTGVSGSANFKLGTKAGGTTIQSIHVWGDQANDGLLCQAGGVRCTNFVGDDCAVGGAMLALECVGSRFSGDTTEFTAKDNYVLRVGKAATTVAYANTIDLNGWNIQNGVNFANDGGNDITISMVASVSVDREDGTRSPLTSYHYNSRGSSGTDGYAWNAEFHDFKLGAGFYGDTLNFVSSDDAFGGGEYNTKARGGGVGFAWTSAQANDVIRTRFHRVWNGSAYQNLVQEYTQAQAPASGSGFAGAWGVRTAKNSSETDPVLRVWLDNVGAFNVDYGLKSHLLPFHGVLNVRDYGAEGDGSTDDTAAFQAVIAAAIALATNGACTIYVPTGAYKLTDELVFAKTDDIVAPIKMVGDGGYSGDGASRMIWLPTTSKRGLVLISTEQFCAEGIEFISGNSNVSVLIDVDAEENPVFSSIHTRFSRCSMRIFSSTSPTTALIRLRNTVQTSFDDCWMGGTAGSSIQKMQLGGPLDGTKAGGGGAGLTTFTRAQLYLDIEVFNTVSTTFQSTVFARASADAPVRIYPAASNFTRQDNTIFIGCSQVSPIDQALSAVNFWTQGTGSEGITALNNRFDGYVVTFDVDGLGYATFSGNTYNPPSNPSGCVGIRLGSTATRVDIGTEHFTALVLAGQTEVTDSRSSPTATWPVTQHTRALRPETDNTYALGTSAKSYSEIWLGGIRIRGVKLTIADDAVGTISLNSSTSGSARIRSNSSGGSGGGFIDTIGTSAFAKEYGTATFLGTTGVLTGTTGTDANTNVSVDSTTLYIENRLGASTTFRCVIED